MEGRGLHPSSAPFHNAGRDHINAPGGIANKSDGSGNHLPGATFHGPVSFGAPLKDRDVDEATTRYSEKAACLRSLGFRDIDTRLHDITAAHRGTCDWLFSTTQFQKWRDRADLSAHNGVLWIKGKPGAGKSTLMKHALRHCEELFGDYLIVAHFFNARGEVLEKTPLGILRSIIYQLLDKDDTLYERFRPIYEKQRMFKEGEWAWPRAQLEDFVRSIINKRLSKPLLLLVDALDECDERSVRDVVGFLESLSIDAVQAGITLRICLSSRHYPNVSMRKTLELTVEANEEHERDIATYVEEKLEGHDNEIKAKVRKKAGGIFMWVVIVVSLLKKAYDDGRLEAMREVLEEVPTDLEDVFNRLLSRDDPDKAETIRMLQWVLLSRRPLKPEELFFAVLAGTAPEYSGLWDRSKITGHTIQRRITALSKGLIEARTGDTASVQFIHLSVSDFLFRNKRLQTLDPTLHPDPISASHGHLWDHCWSDIKQQDTTSTSGQYMKLLSDSYPFLLYAASYIFDHAEKALSGGAMQEKIIQWLQMGNDWFEWWKIFLSTVDSHREHSYLEDNMDTGLLYVLSLRGFPKLVTVVLAEGGADVNAQGGEYSNALQAASYEGHAEIVRQLLERGADVNVQGGRYGNALQAASIGGHAEIVRQLLERGADVNVQGGRYGNALQAASYQGHAEIVRQLLERGADVNAQGGYYGNALQAASYQGSAKIVRQLLERGADVSAQGGYYGNTLQAASYQGSAEIVQQLLERGADINTQGGVFGNALQAASYQGSVEIVRQLLERGADVSAQGGYFANVLQAASVGGSVEIVQQLLERGADVNAQGGYFGNALQAASYQGSVEIVRQLLERGADVNTQGGFFGNALQAASDGGRAEIVRQLLERGADVNTQGGYPGNALQAASYRGRAEIVWQLLERGADINAQGGHYGNALQAASTGGHAEIVRQLLERGVDVNAQGGLFSNTLQAASIGGYAEIVWQLLERGVDVNAQGGHYGNALQAASYRGRAEIVRQLLERGADVNAQGGYFGNALQAASARGHAEIVRQLLERGVDVNVQGGYFGNALQAASYEGYAEIVRQLLKRGAEHNADVHGPGRGKEVSAETVLENRAKCLALRTYVSLHLSWLWIAAA
ncbi:ankyrin repeat-containing domain protein [Parachaetomium inaequale]|uniref:Ankyrin repeat-containing domain protein n=1 Tax=Parachaetomium inaequale TaxID=2588326 RepID=A0AAN6SKI3_9PEZI|nr:ankyrin repeat-containing domain protein [Parachaetomium inaequale]